MVNWSFNSLLLSKLTDVLDLSGNEIANRCKLSQTALYHYMKCEVEIPVQALMQICNALRMPTRYFLSVNNRHIIPTRETATIEADRWKPITWSLDAVEPYLWRRRRENLLERRCVHYGLDTTETARAFSFTHTFPDQQFSLNLHTFQPLTFSLSQRREPTSRHRQSETKGSSVRSNSRQTRTAPSYAEALPPSRYFGA